MNLDHIRSRLDGVRGNGSSFMAKCPSHSDKSPSLSVKDCGDRIVLHCFAGCDTRDVLEAIGLSWGDLFAESLPERITPSLRVEERRRLAKHYEIEFTILFHAKHSSLTKPSDQPRIEKARDILTDLAKRYGMDEFEQIAAHWETRDFGRNHVRA